MAVTVLGVNAMEQHVSAVDKGGSFGVRIEEEDLKKCREFGKAVTVKTSKKD